VFEESEWLALCRAIERPELAQDSRFADVPGRVANATALRAALEAWTSGHDKHSAAALLQRHGVCAAPVCCGRDAFADPQLLATGFLFQVDHPEAGRHRYNELPFRFEGAQDRAREPAPLLGQHTRELLRDWAGLDEAAIGRLLEAGAALQA
jgi:crotonobetainyl-CoA:carnitine CoA-transferase CaiB-like acyl-CoA transferase